jgi:hypothetical protein
LNRSEARPQISLLLKGSYPARLSVHDLGNSDAKRWVDDKVSAWTDVERFLEIRSGLGYLDITSEMQDNLSRRSMLLAVAGGGTGLSDIVLSIAAQCAEQLCEARELFLEAFQTFDWDDTSVDWFNYLIAAPLQQLTEILLPRRQRTMAIVVHGVQKSDLTAYLAATLERLPVWVKLVVIYQTEDANISPPMLESVCGFSSQPLQPDLVEFEVRRIHCTMTVSSSSYT